MIAPATPTAAQQQAALEEMSHQQREHHRRGVQKTYSQAEIARQLGVSRARIEQIEIEAKLKMLKRLAINHPQDFLDLGGNYAQLAFLQHAAIGSAGARRTWKQWRQLANGGG